MKRFGLWTCVLLLLLLMGCGEEDNDSLEAPANLTVDAIAEDRVDLSWEDRSGDEAGFEIQRALQGETYRVLTRTTAGTTSASDATVTLGAAYTYRVRAVSGKKRSTFSNTVEVEIVFERDTAPAPPTHLQAGEVTATSLTLTWVDTATNETGFEIERSRQADFGNVDTLAADMNETRYEDSGLSPDTQYYYRVRAINDTGESVYSNTVRVRTPALPLTSPQAPSGLSAEAVSASRITLAWSDNSDNEAGFILMVSQDNTSFEALHTTGANVATYTHEGLLPETTYYYYVIAYNSAGESEPSPVAQARTPAAPVTPPTAPSELTASELTSNSVRLSWTDTSDDEEGFRLERSERDDFALVDSVNLDPDTTSHHDSNLLADTRYYYRIIAFNSDGDSEASAILEVDTPPEVVPLTAPSNLGTTAVTTTSVSLTWQDNSEGEEGFAISWSTDGGQTFTALDATAADQTTYTHSGLDPETTYRYRVHAYLGQQTSDYSNVVVATTAPLPPAAPAPPDQLAVDSVLATQIALSWRDNADNEAGFTLERAADDSFTDPTAMELEADQTEYTDIGLTPETPYHYRIRAHNGGGVSAYTGPVSATTPAADAIDAIDAIVVDHRSTDITQIPQAAIEQAKADLHIAYGHTSHGSQLTTGMTGLIEFANGGGLGLSLPTDIFAWNNGGIDGALDLEEGDGYGSGWMDHDCGYYPNWVNETRAYLEDPSHSDVNVIIWSWCGQVDAKYADGTLESEYLAPMAQLEADYPEVTFVYMTGHVDIWDDADNKAANQVIRDYCTANDKVLYDFADIERYDPDGVYFEYVHDTCNYYDADTTLLGNWATEWQQSHEEGVEWYSCDASHTQPLNANRKAYAAWWLFARIAGWDGSLE